MSGMGLYSYLLKNNVFKMSEFDLILRNIIRGMEQDFFVERTLCMTLLYYNCLIIFLPFLQILSFMEYMNIALFFKKRLLLSRSL